jgi:hypothetical protein
MLAHNKEVHCNIITAEVCECVLRLYAVCFGVLTPFVRMSSRCVEQRPRPTRTAIVRPHTTHTLHTHTHHTITPHSRWTSCSGAS